MIRKPRISYQDISFQTFVRRVNPGAALFIGSVIVFLIGLAFPSLKLLLYLGGFMLGFFALLAIIWFWLAISGD